MNGRGFTTREQPTTLFNLSKYATPPPTIPPVGTDVRLTLDGDGFVRSIEPLGAPALNGSSEHPPAPTMPPGKDGSIVRMAALKVAARVCPPGAQPEAVLALAARFEAWISRGAA